MHGVKETLRKEYEVTSTGLNSFQTARWSLLSEVIDFHFQLCAKKDGLSQILNL